MSLLSLSSWANDGAASDDCAMSPVSSDDPTFAAPASPPFSPLTFRLTEDLSASAPVSTPTLSCKPFGTTISSARHPRRQPKTVMPRALAVASAPSGFKAAARTAAANKAALHAYRILQTTPSLVAQALLADHGSEISLYRVYGGRTSHSLKTDASHLAVFQALTEDMGVPLDSPYVVVQAAQRGHAQTVAWAVAQWEEAAAGEGVGEPERLVWATALNDAFREAVEYGSLEIAQLLVAHGADVKYQSCPDFEGSTDAYADAVQRGHKDIAKWILQCYYSS